MKTVTKYRLAFIILAVLILGIATYLAVDNRTVRWNGSLWRVTEIDSFSVRLREVSIDAWIMTFHVGFERDNPWPVYWQIMYFVDYDGRFITRRAEWAQNHTYVRYLHYTFSDGGTLSIPNAQFQTRNIDASPLHQSEFTLMRNVYHIHRNYAPLTNFILFTLSAIAFTAFALFSLYKLKEVRNV
jgi:hypothetical protein